MAQRNPKRGLGGGAPQALDLIWKKGACSWWYNWALGSPYKGPLTHVPMQWGKWGIDTMDANLPKNAPLLLMFNEPNHEEQANLTPKEAAAYWPKFEALLAARPDLRLGAPCPAGNGTKNAKYPDPFVWMDAYVAALPPGAFAKHSFTTMHYYGNSVSQLKAQIDRMWATYKKPIWLTEFAAVSKDANVHLKFMEEALTMLDAHPHVERYAWFATSYDAKGWLGPAGLYDPVAGALTPLGEIYTAGAPEREEPKMRMLWGTVIALAIYAGLQPVLRVNPKQQLVVLALVAAVILLAQ